MVRCFAEIVELTVRQSKDIEDENHVATIARLYQSKAHGKLCLYASKVAAAHACATRLHRYQGLIGMFVEAISSLRWSYASSACDGHGHLS